MRNLYFVNVFEEVVSVDFFFSYFSHMVNYQLPSIFISDIFLFSVTFSRCFSATSSGGSEGKESACNAGHLSLIPGLGGFPQRRAWQPTSVFLSGKSPWTEDPGGLQSMGSQRVEQTE